MFKFQMARWPRLSRRQSVTVAVVLVVAASVVALTTTAAQSPVAAAAPHSGDSWPTTPVTASSAATGTAGVGDAPAAVGAGPTGTSLAQGPSATTTPATPPVSAHLAPDPTESSPPPAAPASSPPPAAPAPATTRPPVESLITGRVLYATAAVNVRDAPGTDGTTVIDRLSSGQSVTAGDPVDGWVPVQAGDIYGWVSSTYLADGAPSTPAAAAAPPAAPPAAASSGNWMTDLIPQVDPSGAGNWVFERNGAWGASDGHTIYIDPNVPASKRFSVMVHEYSHVLQVRVYGSLGASVAALSALIGGSPDDVTANESTADCMALMQGATWVNYGCQDSLRDAATAILADHRP